MQVDRSFPPSPSNSKIRRRRLAGVSSISIGSVLAFLVSRIVIQSLNRYPLLRLAGVSGWPRLFHSMQASRQTELQREFPLHVVCSWLGNSPRIAQQSYLLVTEDDFAKAAGVAKVMVEG